MAKWKPKQSPINRSGPIEGCPPHSILGPESEGLSKIAEQDLRQALSERGLLLTALIISNKTTVEISAVGQDLVIEVPLQERQLYGSVDKLAADLSVLVWRALDGGGSV